MDRLAGERTGAGRAWILCPLVVGSAWPFAVGAAGLLQSVALGWGLTVLALVDLASFRLPDAVTLPLIGLGLLTALGGPPGALLDRGAGAALGYASLWALAYGYRRLRGREGLGLGDAKLLAASGAWLGWEALPPVVLIACAAAFLAIGVEGLRGRGWAAGRRLAFGAPLALGAWIVWLARLGGAGGWMG